MSAIAASAPVDASPAPSRRAAWRAALRPRTLPAGAAGIVVGCAAAHGAGALVPWVAALCLLTALLLQLGANLANDYHDWANGADAHRDGPPRATQQGWLEPSAVRRAYVSTLALAVVAATPLVLRGGWPFLAAGLAAVAAAVLYTGGPRPLGYIALGDVLVFAFFGPVAVAGSHALQTGALHETALWAAVPVGLLTTAILVVNNLRDIDSDRRAGKFTLAVRMGPRTTRVYYAALLLVAFAVPPLVLGRAGLWPLLALPLALTPLRVMTREVGRSLDPALPATARLLLVFSLLLAGGLW